MRSYPSVGKWLLLTWKELFACDPFLQGEIASGKFPWYVKKNQRRNFNYFKLRHRVSNKLREGLMWQESWADLENSQNQRDGILDVISTLWSCVIVSQHITKKTNVTRIACLGESRQDLRLDSSIEVQFWPLSPSAPPPPPSVTLREGPELN